VILLQAFGKWFVQNETYKTQQKNTHTHTHTHTQQQKNTICARLLAKQSQTN